MKNIFVFFLFYYLDASILRNIRRKTGLTKYPNYYRLLTIKPSNNIEFIDQKHAFAIQFCVNSESKIECKFFSYALNTSSFGLLIALDKDSLRKINVGFVYIYKPQKNESLPLHSILDCKHNKIHFFDLYNTLNRRKHSIISFNVAQNYCIPIMDKEKHHILPNKNPNDIILIIINAVNPLPKHQNINNTIKVKSYTNYNRPFEATFVFEKKNTTIVNNNAKWKTDKTADNNAKGKRDETAENEKSQKCLVGYYALNSEQFKQSDQNSSNTDWDELSSIDLDELSDDSLYQAPSLYQPKSTIENLSVSSSSVSRSSSFGSIYCATKNNSERSSDISISSFNSDTDSKASKSKSLKKFNTVCSPRENADEEAYYKQLQQLLNKLNNISVNLDFEDETNSENNNNDAAPYAGSNHLPNTYLSNNSNIKTNTEFYYSRASNAPDPQNLSRHYLNKVKENANNNCLENNDSSSYTYFDPNSDICIAPSSHSKHSLQKPSNQINAHKNKKKDDNQIDCMENSISSTSPLDDFTLKTDVELLSASRKDIEKDLIKLYDAVAYAVRHNKEYKEPIKIIINYYLKISNPNKNQFFVRKNCFTFKKGRFLLKKQDGNRHPISKLSPEQQEKKLKNSTIHCDLKDLETNIKNIAQLYLYEQNKEDLAALNTIATEWRNFWKMPKKNKNTSKNPHKDKINLLNNLRNKLKLIIPRLLSFYASEKHEQVAKNYSNLHQKMIALQNDINDENNENFIENVKDIRTELKIFDQPISLENLLANFKVEQQNTTI